MTTMEIIDRLCAVTTELADLVRKQELIIAQHHYLDGEEKRALAAKREAVSDALDILELNLRPYISSCGKEDTE